MATDSIYAPIEFEYLLTYLFGKRSYHGFVGRHHLGRWKREIKKIVFAIQKAAKANLMTDEFHKNELIYNGDETINRLRDCKTIDEINILMIRFLTGIVFKLMGKMPDHWDRKSINKDVYWTLDEFRSLAYTQTVDQKVSLLLSLERRHEYSTRFSGNELLNKFRQDLNGDRDEFIRWFKTKYPDIYLQVF